MVHKYEPIRDYIDFSDAVRKSGYNISSPHFGVLGKALLKASNDTGWLRKQFDRYFSKLRHKRKKLNDLQK